MTEPKDMRKLMIKDRFRVDEIFYSIQGEGKTTGIPAVFVRLSTCNLKCVWCDTPFTWDWDNYDPDKEIKIMTVAEVKNAILEFTSKAKQMPHIVFTGGEPILQQKLIVELAYELRFEGNIEWIEIETNCTIPPSDELINMIDQFNISPKLENSGNKRSVRERKKVYNSFVDAYNLGKDVQFKYVITKGEDFSEVQRLVKEYDIPPEIVFLMPEGISAEQLTERSQWLAEICKKYGYRLCNRLQVMIWGNRRGT